MDIAYNRLEHLQRELSRGRQARWWIERRTRRVLEGPHLEYDGATHSWSYSNTQW